MRCRICARSSSTYYLDTGKNFCSWQCHHEYETKANLSPYYKPTSTAPESKCTIMFVDFKTRMLTSVRKGIKDVG